MFTFCVIFRYTDEAMAAMKGNSTSDAEVSISLFHPKSRGTISLQSNDPKDRPIINSNSLANASDVDVLFHGVKYVLALNQTTVFQNFRIETHLQDAPGCADEKYSDSWLICAIKYWGGSVSTLTHKYVHILYIRMFWVGFSWSCLKSYRK